MCTVCALCIQGVFTATVLAGCVHGAGCVCALCMQGVCTVQAGCVHCSDRVCALCRLCVCTLHPGCVHCAGWLCALQAGCVCFGAAVRVESWPGLSLSVSSAALLIRLHCTIAIRLFSITLVCRNWIAV